MTTAREAPGKAGANADANADARESAEAAGLVYVTDDEPGIRRRRTGRGFSYVDPDGRRIVDRATLERLRGLAIPPAYTDVWICPDPRGHIQATGRDARGRKQYRYHERFRAFRDRTKYEHMIEFAEALPGIRSAVDRHLRLHGLPREKVLATVVRLLEATMIRIGGADYARQNKSYGLTTLRGRHVVVEGAELRFRFKGKSGREWRLSVKDRRIARTVRAIQELPGQRLFQYVDDAGERHDITSGDVNDYLRTVSGRNVTAKDFRTWAGTVLAATALAALERTDNRAAMARNVRAAVRDVAGRLGNTPAVCHRCYIHPEILDSYLEGSLALDAMGYDARDVPAPSGGEPDGLLPEEEGVLAFLRSRLKQPAVTS